MIAGAPAAAGTRRVATSAPAVAGGVGGPAEPAGMMTSAPAAAGSRGAAASAPAVVGGFGGNVFPAESVGMMAGAPAAAGSSGAASSVRPPPAIAFASDDHEDYQHKQFGGCDCDTMIFAAAQAIFSSICAEGCAGGEHVITRSASRFWLFA